MNVKIKKGYWISWGLSFILYILVYLLKNNDIYMMIHEWRLLMYKLLIYAFIVVLLGVIIIIIRTKKYYIIGIFIVNIVNIIVNTVMIKILEYNIIGNYNDIIVYGFIFLIIAWIIIIYNIYKLLFYKIKIESFIKVSSFFTIPTFSVIYMCIKGIDRRFMKIWGNYYEYKEIKEEKKWE